MPGLVPGIHVLFVVAKTWMAGSSPAMTAEFQELYSAPRLAALANFFSTRSRFSFDK
jgi:hypothetical protein